jgi:hypothetical protein
MMKPSINEMRASYDNSVNFSIFITLFFKMQSNFGFVAVYSTLCFIWKL